jgi:hypothetical protein
MMSNFVRCTVVDDEGAVSFVTDGDALPALTAACAQNPRSLEQLLAISDGFYRDLRERVLNGLAVFDELNAPGNYDTIHQAFQYCSPHEQPVFRVVDDATREMSKQAVKTGVVLFNLRAKRIVQIQNSYREIRRSGRARVFDGRTLTNSVFSYKLPREWALVP